MVVHAALTYDVLHPKSLMSTASMRETCKYAPGQLRITENFAMVENEEVVHCSTMLNTSIRTRRTADALL